jgi:hypothetical protein
METCQVETGKDLQPGVLSSLSPPDWLTRPMIRLAILLPCIFLALATVHGETPIEPKLLAWKLKAGQKIRAATQSEMTRTTKIKSNIDETKIRTIIDLLWEVKQVDDQGIATIEQRPERLAITLEHRLDPKYELDSDQLKKNPNLKGADRDALRLLLEGTSTIKLDPRGIVLEASVPPDWAEKLKTTSLASLHDQLVRAATPQLLEGVQLTLPAEAIEVGHEWLVEAPKKVAADSAPTGSAKFTYRGEKPLDGETRDQIEIEFTIAGLGDAITVTSQSNRAQFWFDSAVGLPAKLQLNQAWKAEKPYRDIVILLTTTGTSTTTWSVVQ